MAGQMGRKWEVLSERSPAFSMLAVYLDIDPLYFVVVSTKLKVHFDIDPLYFVVEPQNWRCKNKMLKEVVDWRT